jgi:hypothetical protein
VDDGTFKRAYQVRHIPPHARYLAGVQLPKLFVRATRGHQGTVDRSLSPFNKVSIEPFSALRLILSIAVSGFSLTKYYQKVPNDDVKVEDDSNLPPTVMTLRRPQNVHSL